MPFNHILLTTDLSEPSARAFAPIAEMARAAGAKVTVLHVVNVHLVRAPGAPLAPPLSLPIDEEAVNAARAALPKWCAEHAPGLECSCAVVAATTVADAIVDESLDRGCDLIAMSTHGRSGLARLFLGSVADQVLRRATVPVMCFPPPRQELAQKNAP